VPISFEVHHRQTPPTFTIGGFKVVGEGRVIVSRFIMTVSLMP